MSQSTRVVALMEAVKLAALPGGSGVAASVVVAAERFNAFLEADTVAITGASKPGAEPPKPPPTPPAKPAAAKPAPKPAAAPKPPAKTEEQLAAEAMAAAEAEAAAEDAAAAAADTEATEEAVGEVITRMLAGGKRPQAIALLKKFGATSKSGVKIGDYAAFIAEGRAELGDDLTS